MDKPIYQMSMVGSCSRTLAAHRLGYEPTPQSVEDIARLNHYSRLESVAAVQIMDLGYRIEPSSKCQTCLTRYGTERYGIHVEIDTSLYLLVGHLDRRLILDGKWYPIEIKSLGKSSWMKFQREQFNGFASYAGQECVYLEAEGVPGIYWIMERDTGNPQKYIVNDFKNELQRLDGFERVTLPITFTQIEDKLNLIELSVQENQLPEGEEGSECFWCRYRYLCLTKGTEGKEAKEETAPNLVEAASLYKESKEYEMLSKEAKEKATQIFLAHSKSNNVDKFRVSGVSFSYRGQKVKEYLDSSALKKDNLEIYQKYLKKSSPYDDFSIRLLGDKKEKE